MGTLNVIDGASNPQQMSVAGSGTVADPYAQRVALYGAATDAAGRMRVSQSTTLFDGKALNSDEPLLWNNVGTGTTTFANNAATMTVAAGQYQIRSSKYYLQYFSGKSQLIEMTSVNLQPEVGLTKRVGYFSSNAVAPYDTNKDGFWIESRETGMFLVVQKLGVVVVDLPFASFDNYAAIAAYDWSQFTVLMFDFLWLGGTSLRITMHINGEFVVATTYRHAGNVAGTFINSPNQTVRYEIRSTTGAGSLTAVCSQVSTETHADEAGKTVGLLNSTGIPCNSAGTFYALLGIKKIPAFRDSVVEVMNFGALRLTSADTGIIFLILNPTLSAPLTYVAQDRINVGNTAVPITITPGTGTVIAAYPAGQATDIDLEQSAMSYLQIDIDDVPGELVLGYLSTSNNQTLRGIMNVKRY